MSNRSDRVDEITQDVKKLAGRADPGLALILSEEFAREVGRELASRMPKIKSAKTRVINYSSLSVNGIREVFSDAGEGTLVDLQIMADSTAFILGVDWDDQRFDKTYTEIAALGGYFGIITAQQDSETGSYVVTVTGISFHEGLTIRLRTSASVTFTVIGTVDVRS